MTTEKFSLEAYLNRIGYSGSVNPDLATLRALMSYQLRSVPFENTEVQAKRIPSLNPEDIYTKIVTHKRGGYCYEINGLFAMALTEIGFDWYFAGARPMFYPMRRPKTHMIVIVMLDGAHYLCDTGFGGYGLREPMKVVANATVEQNNDQFSLEFKDDEFILSSRVNDTWMLQYGFSLVKQEWIEFSLANYFNATHPDSIFTQKKLAIVQTLNGRKILIDNSLKRIDNGVMSVDEVTYETAALEHFGLTCG